MHGLTAESASNATIAINASLYAQVVQNAGNAGNASIKCTNGYLVIKGDSRVEKSHDTGLVANIPSGSNNRNACSWSFIPGGGL